LVLGLSCTGAKSATVTLSYKVRVATAMCETLPCTTPFVPFLETFDVTLDPSVLINEPTTMGLNIISINRPYSSVFTNVPFPEVGGEDATLTVGAPGALLGGASCAHVESTYCLFIDVNLSGQSTGIGFLETTATGETWSGTSIIPEPSTWLMVLLGFVGLALAGHRLRST
jgi:hypothetical protein